MRAAVLGTGDGLLTNVSLVLGVVGASVGQSFVRWQAYRGSWPAPCPWRLGSSCRSGPKTSPKSR
jgi:hypothetical protein